MAARVISVLMRIRSIKPSEPLRRFHKNALLLSSESDVKRVEIEDDRDGNEDSSWENFRDMATTDKINRSESMFSNATYRTRFVNDHRSDDVRSNAYNNSYKNDARSYARFDSRNHAPGFQTQRSGSTFFEDIPVNTPDYDPTVQMDVYKEHTMTAEREKGEILKYYKENNIRVINSDDIKPILTFDEISSMEYIKKLIGKNGWTSPFPIQAMTWPIALSGKDMIGIAQTGSGKTLGYILPAIVHIRQQRQTVQRHMIEPTVLILTPTRELTQQVEKVAMEVGKDYKIHTGSAFGGGNRGSQLRNLRGADICVATPGRLNDYLSNGIMNLRRCTYVVVDEADRMLDMGFEVQLKQILRYIQPNRQMLMWSATWPKEIQSLAAVYLKNPVQVRIGSLELMANPNVEQNFILTSPYDKASQVVKLLSTIASEYPKECKTLIFTEKKRTADDLHNALLSKGIPTVALHGDKKQQERDRIMGMFREKKKIILIATDVASRGLDVADIYNVINYDMPANGESYVHRIGRTARGGRKGRAFSLVTKNDIGVVKSLVQMYNRHQKKVPDELAQMVFSDRRHSSKRGIRFDRVDPLWRE
ncbi:uncharacterized protein LOC132559375 [Ylistrum balloti]|uniref:uncharacterized protein LOC132559375 n=1 Tax=Ylistrum balloti TaxID=509963 RepID=UPI002905D937|nr:uncharacterized protein LOC132559375 [Ylistrum balloti]